jgi:F-box-like
MLNRRVGGRPPSYERYEASGGNDLSKLTKPNDALHATTRRRPVFGTSGSLFTMEMVNDPRSARLTGLPDELIILICSQLPQKALSRLAVVCRRLRALTESFLY